VKCMEKWHKVQNEILNLTKDEMHNIVITFSGGKDSTALVFAVLNAFKDSKIKPERIWIIYSNTLVDPPPLLNTAEKSLRLFQKLGKNEKIPIIPQIVVPSLKDRFWVLLIGKGYPPPSVKFRWCSERLKIRPIRNFLRRIKEKRGHYPIILTGVRLSENDNRKRKLLTRLLNGKWMKFEGLPGALVYAPLLELKTEEIWDYIKYNEKRWEVDLNYLRKLYSITSNGVNTFRTGCWVCTLVRRDRSLEKLAREEKNLQQLLELREFLIKIRDNKNLRMTVSKNGKVYKGPLNLEVRQLLLRKIKKMQVISKEEEKLIYKLWNEFQTISKGDRVSL